MSILIVSDLGGVRALQKPSLFVMEVRHTFGSGINHTSNKATDSIFVVTADSFQALPLSFPLCYTAEQADEKAWMLPALALVRS